MRRFALLIGFVVFAALLSPISLSAEPVGAQSAEIEDLAGTKVGDIKGQPFDLRVGVEQITVGGVKPGVWVRLQSPKRVDGKKRMRTVTKQRADEQGTAIFRLVDAGKNYRVRVGKANSKKFRVNRAEKSTPKQKFYDRQTLVPGLNYIETRDGTTLSAFVALPGPAEDGPYPTVLEYSGYDPSNPTQGGPAQPSTQLANFLGYAVVGVNVRGTGCSGGAYDFFETMQVLDGYDAIEAVAAQDWVLNNKVGMVGLSYPGISQMFVAQSQPPSLSSIAPVSVYGDTATGVSRPGGILNTGFAVSWAEGVLRNAEAYGPGWVREVIEDGDTVCDENQALRGHNVNAAELARENKFYDDVIAPPLDIRTFVDQINVPVFLASAWQDEQTGPSFGDILSKFENSPSAKYTVYNGLHADGFAPQILVEWNAFLDIYVAGEVPSIPDAVRAFAPGLTTGIFGGPIELPEDRWGDVSTVEEAREKWESEPAIRMIMESGAGGDDLLPIGAWEVGVDEWPLTTTGTRWWLTDDGGLTDQEPSEDGGVYRFAPDPAVGETAYWTGGGIWSDPVYEWEPHKTGKGVTVQSAPLDADVVMAGTASVDLWISSTEPDADLEVLLTEVDADGNETLVQVGWLRASYRKLADTSTELRPEMTGTEADNAPLPKGEFVEARILIPAFAHAFREGSSVRLTINTPGGDQPQWFFELLETKANTKHFIGTGAEYPSSIALPVVDGIDVPTPAPNCGALRGQPCRPAADLRNILRK